MVKKQKLTKEEAYFKLTTAMFILVDIYNILAEVFPDNEDYRNLWIEENVNFMFKENFSGFCANGFFDWAYPGKIDMEKVFNIARKMGCKIGDSG